LIRDKVLGWPSLKRRLDRERRRGRRIVFTNGVFDILHAGHLKVFEWSKRQGDVLVVGVNSDASVRRLKGPKRPIVPQAERQLLIAGLEPVDFVTLFSDDTPARLIKLIQPDVLVKGGDYRPDQIVGREHAGKVVRIPLVKGKSTTNIVEKIAKLYGR
jgi:D-beta-D-heptose 7-phosphate kinase/D-beta-D-heptose 1-phosphate adenosyltransferase